MIGEFKREVVKGVVPLEDEEAGDPVEQFGSGQLVLVPGLPVDGGSGHVEWSAVEAVAPEHLVGRKESVCCRR